MQYRSDPAIASAWAAYRHGVRRKDGYTFSYAQWLPARTAMGQSSSTPDRQLGQPSVLNGGLWNGAVSWPICRTTRRTTRSLPALVTQIFPIVPMGVLSNGPRLPTMVPPSPGFSSPCGARSAQAHSLAPGFSFIAASFAHLNGVLITLPPSVLNVLSGPRQ